MVAPANICMAIIYSHDARPYESGMVIIVWVDVFLDVDPILADLSYAAEDFVLILISFASNIYIYYVLKYSLLFR